MNDDIKDMIKYPDDDNGEGGATSPLYYADTLYLNGQIVDINTNTQRF